MNRREHKHAREDVHGLMAELGELVEDLGLKNGTRREDPTAPPNERPEPAAEAAAEPPSVPVPPRPLPPRAPLSAPPPPSAPVWRSGPEVLTGAAASALRGEVAERPAPPVEPTPPPPAIPAPSPPPPPAQAEPVLLELAPAPEPPLEAVPLWETAEPEPPRAYPEPEPATPGVTLWDAFSPELAAAPPRPWSPAAAMVVVEPAAPPGAPARTTRAAERFRPHAFTILTAVAVLVAAAIFTFSRLDLGHTTGPAQPVAHAAFILDTLRTVAASSPDRVPQARTTTEFPANAAAIYLDVTYRNVVAADTLQVVILLKPQQNGQPTVAVSDQTHRSLNPNGEQVITVEAPPGGFTPGTYEVRALHDGTLEQSTTFTVR